MKRNSSVPKIVVAMLISALSVGCGDSTGPVPSAEGTYALRSVDGHSLPWVMFDDAELKFDVPSGNLILKAGGVCSSTIILRQTDKKTSIVTNDPLTGSCHYVIAGGTITITDDEDASKTTGTISNGRITVTDDNVMVFSK